MRLNQYSDTQPLNSVASVLSHGLVEESSLRGDRGFLSLHVSGCPGVLLSVAGPAVGCYQAGEGRWGSPGRFPHSPVLANVCSSCLEGAMTRKRFFTDTSGEKKKNQRLKTWTYSNLHFNSRSPRLGHILFVSVDHCSSDLEQEVKEQSFATDKI